MAFVTREELNPYEEVPTLVFLVVSFMYSWLVFSVLMLVHQVFSCHTFIVLGWQVLLVLWLGFGETT
jgi:hypothetical protein